MTRPAFIAVAVLSAAIGLAGPVLSGPREAPGDLRALHAAGRHTAAESLATAVLERLASSGDPDSVTIALASFVLGTALFEQGKWEHDRPRLLMQRSFDIRSRHLPPEHLDLGLSAMRLAEYEADFDPAAAIDHARAALAIFEAQPSRNDTLIANTLVDIGQIEIILGKNREAIEPLDRAIELRSRLFGPKSRPVASCLESLGDAWFALGDLEKCRGFQERALSIHDGLSGRDNIDRGGPISRLTEVHQALGDFARAIDYAHESARLAVAAGDTAEIVASHINLAVILQEFGDFEGVCRVASAILPLCDYFPERYGWIGGSMRQIYGTASLAIGDTTRAMRLLDEAIATLTAHPEAGGEWRVVTCFMSRAQARYGQKRYAEARADCDEAIRLNETAPMPQRTIRVTSRALLLRILEAAGQTAEIDSIRRELEALREEPGYAGALAPTISYWVARAENDLGRTDAAWNGALEAERETRERMHLNVATLPDSRALELARRKSYVLGLVLELSERDPSRWDAAWDRVVRTRGLVRSELNRRRLPPELRFDPGLAALHDAWRTAQGALARHLVRESAAPRDSAARAERDRFRREAEHAEAAYARALSERGRVLTPADAGLAEVRASLRPGVALAAFAEYETLDGPRRLIAFIARGGEPAIERIDIGLSADVEQLVAEWRESLSEPQRSTDRAAERAEREARRLGEEVRRLVWDPIVERIGPSLEIDIVPDGAVADLPWHALPAGERMYFVEEFPSIRVLDAERDVLLPSRPSASHTLLAIGDPDYGAEPGGGAARIVAAAMLRGEADPCANLFPHRFPPLPATGVEVRDVARAWGQSPGHEATMLLGERATETAFKELAPRSAIVHVATHGFAVGQGCSDGASGVRGVGGLEPLDDGERKPGPSSAPGRSNKPSPWMGRRVWLAMASADHAAEAGSNDDGLLTAEEVVTLDLSQAEWVVLSACHSGLAGRWGEEGAVGMRRAFLLAGARAVIVSGWGVEDTATAELMRALYEERAAGEARASAALRGAQRSVLEARRAAGRSTHPFYWAAFSASGD